MNDYTNNPTGNRSQSSGDPSSSASSKTSPGHSESSVSSSSQPSAHDFSGSGSGGATVAETTRTEIPAQSSPSSEANEKKQRARQRLSETGDRLRSQAERAADGVRHRAAEEVRIFGSAMNAAADQLDEKQHERVGAYAHGINSTCENVADYIENANVSEVAEDFSDRARQNPALFLGAAAIAGLALGRLLSATPPKPKHEQFGSPTPGRPAGSPRAGGSSTHTQEPRLSGTTTGSIPASSEPRHTTSPINQHNEGSSHDYR